MSRQVFLVGHCGFDGPRLQKEIGEKMQDVEVERVNSEEDLQKICDSEGVAVLCVNREPVGFDRDGLEIVRDVCQSHPKLRVMLVSDHPDAQEEAERLGAIKGFGKSEIGKESLIERIEEAMEQSER